jgi:hypothetical protein
MKRITSADEKEREHTQVLCRLIVWVSPLEVLVVNLFVHLGIFLAWYAINHYRDDCISIKPLSLRDNAGLFTRLLK